MHPSNQRKKTWKFIQQWNKIDMKVGNRILNLHLPSQLDVFCSLAPRWQYATEFYSQTDSWLRRVMNEQNKVRRTATKKKKIKETACPCTFWERRFSWEAFHCIGYEGEILNDFPFCSHYVSTSAAAVKTTRLIWIQLDLLNESFTRHLYINWVIAYFTCHGEMQPNTAAL